MPLKSVGAQFVAWRGAEGRLLCAVRGKKSICNVLAEVLAAVGSTFTKWRALPSNMESARSVHQNRVGLGMHWDLPTLALG